MINLRGNKKIKIFTLIAATQVGRHCSLWVISSAFITLVDNGKWQLVWIYRNEKTSLSELLLLFGIVGLVKVSGFY